VKSSGSRWQKGLMPFVERGYQTGTGPGQCCPLQAPPGSNPGKRGAPRAEQKCADSEIADEVAAFAKQHVPAREPQWIQIEQKMEKRIKDLPGIVRGTEIARFHNDYSQADR